MNWLGRIIQKEIGSNDIVLDLGCGIMQATTDVLNGTKFGTKRYFADMINYKMGYSLKGNLKCKSILGCDIWSDYLKKTSLHYPTIRLQMNELDKFVNNSYDAIICLDVLEHLELSESMKTIDEMKRIARKKVIIYTPSKYMDNQEHVENAWDLGNNPYQLHRCFLDPEVLQTLGFRVSFPEPDKNTLGIFTKKI